MALMLSRCRIVGEELILDGVLLLFPLLGQQEWICGCLVRKHMNRVLLYQRPSNMLRLLPSTVLRVDTSRAIVLASDKEAILVLCGG